MFVLKSEVNPSAPQLKGWGLLRVDPERPFSTPPSKAGLGAVERVKWIIYKVLYLSCKTQGNIWSYLLPRFS